MLGRDEEVDKKGYRGVREEDRCASGGVQFDLRQKVDRALD